MTMDINKLVSVKDSFICINTFLRYRICCSDGNTVMYSDSDSDCELYLL